VQKQYLSKKNCIKTAADCLHCRWFRRRWQCRVIRAAKSPAKTRTCLQTPGRFRSTICRCWLKTSMSLVMARPIARSTSHCPDPGSVGCLQCLQTVTWAARLSCYNVGLSIWRTFLDLWLTCDHFVGKVSIMRQPTRPTQSSNHSGSVKWVVMYVITWITRVETIKRQTRAACGCLAASLCVQA